MGKTSPPDNGLSIQQRNIEAIARLEQAVLGERSPGERLGRLLIRRAGRPSFVALHAVMLLAWLMWNSMGVIPAAWRFDPAPFAILELVATLEAIFLALLILISQNRLQREADHRAHLNLQINMMAEMEGTKIIQMLGQIGRHLDIADLADESLTELGRDTDPAHLAESIKRDIIDEEN